MLNRRGQQEGGSLGVIITIILIVIVAIFVAYFFISSSNRGAAVFGNLQTSQLQSVVTSCQAAASVGATAEYCAILRKVDSNTYVNCDYSQISSSLSNPLDCGGYQNYQTALNGECKSKITSFNQNIRIFLKTSISPVEADTDKNAFCNRAFPLKESTPAS